MRCVLSDLARVFDVSREYANCISFPSLLFLSLSLSLSLPSSLSLLSLSLAAAKLYEQAVLKFADWYAECFATDEERTLVHAVKIPSHLNLAM